MATDHPQAAQPAMEDILSSIRDGVVEETAKVGSGSADLIDAAAAQDAEDDIFDLTDADMVATPAAGAESEELIDIAAFGQSGEAKAVDSQTAADLAADILGESPMMAAPEAEVAAAAPAEEGGAADEFDRLLAEISQEQQQNVAAAEVTKQALMDEEEPLGAPEVEADEEVSAEEPLMEAVEEAAVAELSQSIAGAANFKLGMVDGPEGVQIAFPAEVLAMALRPMVQEWLAKNLPGVVEKLVKEEISKLTQN